MADIKWIKITTDMFDNRKIKHIRKMPDGDSMVLLWVMLLTLAGRCNANGWIFLTNTFPYSTKMLADELDFEENTVVLALKLFESLGMIEFDGDFIAIANWEEYQNIEGMDKIREQTRKRVAKHRENQKKLTCNATCNVTVTQCNATEEDIDKEEDKELEENLSLDKLSDSNISSRYYKQGDSRGVKFTPPSVEEVAEYCKKRNNDVDPQAFIDFYESKAWMIGKNKMKDWKAAVRTWENRRKESKPKLPTYEPTEQEKNDLKILFGDDIEW